MKIEHKKSVTPKSHAFFLSYARVEFIYWSTVPVVSKLTNWDGLLELRYVTLDTDHQKVFNAVVDAWNNKATRPY